MLDNTYDATGINYGILISPDFPYIDDQVFQKNDKEAINNEIIDIISNKNCNILDFSEIDGLTIDEVLNHNKLQLKNTIIVIAYTKMNFTSKNDLKHINTNILNKIIVKRNDFNKNQAIDKEVERILVNSYNSENNVDNRIVKCFLERYRYGSKQETDKKLKEYTK